MKNMRLFAGLSLILGTFVAQSAFAQVPFSLVSSLASQDDDDDEDLDDEDLDDEDEEEGEGEGEATTAKPKEGEVDYGGADVGDSVGGATGFVRHSGFYTASDLGGFIRFGGFTQGNECNPQTTPCKARPTSNLQPWIKLGVGYDVFNLDSFQFSTQLSFATGFIANAAPVQNAADSPRDYALAMVNVELIGTYFIERIGITGKIFGGGAFLSPPPLPEAVPYGGDIGVGVGVTWATLLTDVTIGIDFNGMAVFTPSGAGAPGTFFTGFSFAPVIKYVF